MFKKQQGKQIVQEYIESQNVIKRYIKGNLLGKGGFAKCYQFISEQTGRKYASKIIQKSSLSKPKAKQKLQSQIKIHKSLHHPHIVNFQHFFQDNEFVYILLEICRPQTLNDLLKRRKRITQFQVKYYIHQIVEALKYLHKGKVIHRDLKLGNLFLTDQLRIKVGDFGLAAKLTTDLQRKKTTCGTPNYLAPQILTNKNGHSYQVDVWSVGIIVYALLFGRPPFQTNDLKLTYGKIKTCNYSFPQNISVSNQAKRFITKILQLQPHKRPNLEQILQDQFMCSIQIPKSMPLATISIPPSANFMKKYEKQIIENLNEAYISLNQPKSDQNTHLNSFRTLQRNKIMMSTDRLQVCDKRDVTKRSTSKQTTHMQRAASTAGLLQRKRTSFKQVVSKEPVKQVSAVPVRVLYFQQNQKFGICYMLSSCSIGMRYNDATCLLSNSSQSKIKYITMQPSLKQITSNIYDFNQTPTELNKKIKIINHYMKELKARKEEVEGKMANQFRIALERMRTKENKDNLMGVYVVRSLKTTKAHFFQFNNAITQVVFEDSSELIFNNSYINCAPKTVSINIVSYITKFSELKQFVYSELEQQSEDVKKRMNYAINVTQKVKKSILTKEAVYSQENKAPSGQITAKQSIKNQKTMNRCSSSSKFSIPSNFGSNVQNQKNYMSTNKLRTINTVTHVLKDISNKVY